MNRSLPVGWLLTCTVLVLARPVAAQPRVPVRGGLSGLALSEVLAASDLALEGIVVPELETDPVRLELGRNGRVHVLVDVRIAADPSAALRLLDAIAPALSSHGVLRRAGLGDRAYVDDAGALAAFVRGNVVVIVLVLEASDEPSDALELSRRLVLACDASARLAAQRAALSFQPASPRTAPSSRAGESREDFFPMPEGAVAMRVIVHGEGVARAVAGGWIVSGTTPDSRVEVVVVDRLLRVHR